MRFGGCFVGKSSRYTDPAVSGEACNGRAGGRALKGPGQVLDPSLRTRGRHRKVLAASGHRTDWVAAWGPGGRVIPPLADTALPKAGRGEGHFAGLFWKLIVQSVGGDSKSENATWHFRTEFDFQKRCEGSGEFWCTASGSPCREPGTSVAPPQLTDVPGSLSLTKCRLGSDSLSFYPLPLFCPRGATLH